MWEINDGRFMLTGWGWLIAAWLIITVIIHFVNTVNKADSPLYDAIISFVLSGAVALVPTAVGLIIALEPRALLWIGGLGIFVAVITLITKVAEAINRRGH